MESKKIKSLTGMRFIAIIIIVISHLEFIKNIPNGQIYWKFFHNPEIGVDFFFVLSGFGLMLSDIKRNGYNIDNTINIKNLFIFAYNHIKKIYPVYIATIILCIPIYLYYALTSGKAITLIVKLTIIKLFACIGVVQSLFGVSWLSHSFNGVCWFLSALCCVYFISPFLIKTLKKYCLNIKRTLFCLVSFLFLLPVFIYLFKSIQQITFFDDLTYGSPFIRVFYVIFGMIIAILFKKTEQTKRQYNLIEGLVFGSYVIYYLFRKEILFSLHYISIIYIIDLLFAGLVIYTLACNKGFISKIMSKPFMVYLGTISMYIFLIHYPIRLYSAALLMPYFTDCTIVWLTVIVILTVTFVISHILYKAEK